MFIFNEPHANELESALQESAPRGSEKKAQRLGLLGLPWSPEQAGGLRGLGGVCPPTPGSQGQEPGQAPVPMLLWGEGSSGEGTTVPVDGVRQGRGCLPGQMASRLPALEAKWILMKSQPQCRSWEPAWEGRLPGAHREGWGSVGRRVGGDT